jgi:methionyl-tRNA formyltransferase
MLPTETTPTRVVYMGTPAFAVPMLEALHAAPDLNVVGVITAVDKPGGRGNQLLQSAVKQKALQLGLQLLQPPNLKAESFVAELTALRPDVQVVVAFRMLPQVVWALPPLGTFNLHASLLPRYRGAAPIHWAVLNGETETGLTTFLLDAQIDTGAILLQQAVAIGPRETTGELHDRLMNLGPELVLRTVRGLRNGTLKPQVQPIPTVAMPHAPKLHPEMGLVVWPESAQHVANHIRGLSPYPAAWSLLEGKRIKLLGGAYVYDGPTEGLAAEPGSFTLTHNGLMVVRTGDSGAVVVPEVQLEGKKAMPPDAWLRGYTPAVWRLSGEL